MWWKSEVTSLNISLPFSFFSSFFFPFFSLAFSILPTHSLSLPSLLFLSDFGFYCLLLFVLKSIKIFLKIQHIIQSEKQSIKMLPIVSSEDRTFWWYFCIRFDWIIHLLFGTERKHESIMGGGRQTKTIYANLF